jgi:hypothetical protein
VANSFDQDPVKRRQRARQVSLHRYQLICPALEPGLSTKQRGKVVREIAGRTHVRGARRRSGRRPVAAIPILLAVDDHRQLGVAGQQGGRDLSGRDRQVCVAG